MFAINFRTYSNSGKYEEDSFENSEYKVLDTLPYVYGIFRSDKISLNDVKKLKYVTL